MKTCFKCNIAQPEECFYKHSEMKDGSLNKCIECTKKDQQQNYLEHRESKKAYDKKRNQDPERKKKRLAYQRKMRAKAPHKYLARSKVRRALKKGALSKNPCEVCGNPQSEAHHHDYNQPLDVRWLCLLHHRIIEGRSVSIETEIVR